VASAIDTAQQAIEARFDGQWGTTSEVAWPNVDFTPPSNDDWVKIDIVWGDGFMETMNGRNRLYGIIQVSVYVPRGAGRGTLLSRTNTARDVFNRWDGSGVRCKASSPPQPIPDPQWDRADISTAFDYEETV
jgi:hypothetical protein